MIDVDKAFGFYAAVLRGISQRQQANAHNIANQNTPGFTAKTVPFQRVLGDALREQGGDLRGVTFPVEEVPDLPVNANGNNVNLEREWMQVEENRLLHEVFARAAGSRIRSLLDAIRSR